HDPVWKMTFAWLHPLSRHRGVFSAAWEIFIHRYLTLQVAPLTLAIRAALHGKPHRVITDTTGAAQRLYDASPMCSVPGHGGMIEHSPGLWRCGMKMPEGGACTEHYIAPSKRARAGAEHA